MATTRAGAGVDATERKLSSVSLSAGGGQGPSWQSCYYCTREHFKSIAEFVSHLRNRHCSKEGGSYVCRYGFNGVCASLPLDGVSDRDYDAHVAKYHVNQQTREMPPEWGVYSAAQNLPAVLNDPSKGKQSNLFTKKWGEHFVERSPQQIAGSSRLPDITHKDFSVYLGSIGKRYRWHERRQQQQLELEKDHTKENGTLLNDHTLGDLKSVPEIFLKSQLQLHHPATFKQVFPHYMETSPAERPQTGRQLQEQLSHYLDIVEVKIAQQVAQKSGAFFHAMTTQHAILAEMEVATEQVRHLRLSLSQLHETSVVDSFRVLLYAKRRQHYNLALDKLRLMATVHKTQPMLQLLLGTQDYVAALDLIGTTQEILSAELLGVHCFKHLPMQLSEMEKLIDKMLTTEFERYVAADLNRPLSEGIRESDSVCAEEDKLVSIIMGLLRKQNFSFVQIYQQESIATIRAIIKQLLIEVLTQKDSGDQEITLTGAGEQSLDLSLGEWICLLQRSSQALSSILERIRVVVGIMQQTADAAVGAQDAVNLIDSEAFLSQQHHENLKAQLDSLLQAVCHYCHERCANIVSTQSLERSSASEQELKELTETIEQFSETTRIICGVQSVPLQLSLKVQATRYAQKFHAERKHKLSLLLDQERWRQVDIPQEFQRIIDRLANADYTKYEKNSASLTHLSNGNGGVIGGNPVLLVDGKQPYALVSASLMLIQMLYEYGASSLRLPILASYHARNIVDLLRLFNSRSCQLIIGAGAMRVAGLKTITSTNLALVSRALQLVLWLLPKLRQHFHSMSGYESIERDYQGHIKEIENKIHGIVSDRVNSHLEAWDARPPIPSQTFRHISRHLVKLHEAIAGVLPETQIHEIYAIVHRNFKDKLREQLLKLNINNNGGPQHGVVTSELTFYMETLRTLKALPPPQLDNSILEDIWLY
ncbi:uncharacterized protein Dwil_GK24205 [Drosophila willistoni]|uniref:Vacuolar protein sorting-associated protein 54 n=1 Tax=Drosophila willistoni TaxID=7260 RepID=B4N1D6_DROWI|nr:vacuolar protein sorting-associated protein 54 [Drosophila willistoni]EDW78073.1 uncharacterized protein Dwil_GK24205 [Drosophila willistoni]